MIVGGLGNRDASEGLMVEGSSNCVVFPIAIVSRRHDIE